MLSEKDKVQIKAKGITLEQVNMQFDRFSNGFPTLAISAPATLGDGIISLNEEEMMSFIERYETVDIDVIKFVPASGAATRMFKSLYQFVETFECTKESFQNCAAQDDDIRKFFENIQDFAFYEQLAEVFQRKHGISISESLKNYRHDQVIKCLLDTNGLGYGNLPKGLLSFHKYDKSARTAAAEHLVEGENYAKKNGAVNIHFTVSVEHLPFFKEHINQCIASSGSEAKINVSYSIQQASTDTIASSLTYTPFRDESGKLLFRPAGHGALLENLNELSADVIFVKNIDNVLPDTLKPEAITYKKALAGVLLKYQEAIFDLLRKHEAGENISVEGKKLLDRIGIKGAFSESEIVDLLNRPIRVCGMVKNEGEPGGGPFWVQKGKITSLQIVESAQVDQENSNQLALFQQGTHFNPVDLVCGTKNYKGEKFDLIAFRDDDTGFISEKSYNGEKLLAMELPGLWNGSMAHWNTIFVEVSLSTFNPVKKVTDLLKPAHCIK